METAISILIQVLKYVVICLLMVTVLTYFVTGVFDISPITDLVNGFVSSILMLPVLIGQMLVCVAVKVIDIAITIIWDLVPGLSDVFSAPSVSSIISGC